MKSSKPSPTPSLGELADQLYLKGEEISQATSRVTILKAEEAAMEHTLLDMMKDAGTDIVRGNIGTCSKVKYKRPQLKDFEKFRPFLIRQKAYHLFERRIAPNAYKELMEQRNGKPIPGIELFEEDRVRTVKRAAK